MTILELIERIKKIISNLTDFRCELQINTNFFNTNFNNESERNIALNEIKKDFKMLYIITENNFGKIFNSINKNNIIIYYKDIILTKINKYKANSNWILFLPITNDCEFTEKIEGITLDDLTDLTKAIKEKLTQKDTNITEALENIYEENTEKNKERIGLNIQRLNEDNNFFKNEIKRYEQLIENNNKKIELNIEDINKIDNKKNNFKKQVEDIKNHPKVTDIYIDNIDGSLVIKTTELRMTNNDIEDDIRLLGEMEICIRLTDFDIKLYNLTNKRHNYWGYEGNHPHVSTNGVPCLGNSAEMIVQAQDENDYYLAFLICLSYLETYDYTDCAGAYYVSWDRIDEEGNILEEGHLPGDYYTCTVCGEEIEEEDAYYCDYCENYVCEEHSYYLEKYDCTVCTECLDEYFIYCDFCNEYVKPEDAETLNGEMICDECVEEIATRCECCGELVLKEDAIEYDYKILCKDCYEELTEENEEV